MIFDKETSGGTIKNEIMSSKEIVEELRKPIITKFEKRKVHSSFMDNIRVANLADIQFIVKID